MPSPRSQSCSRRREVNGLPGTDTDIHIHRSRTRIPSLNRSIVHRQRLLDGLDRSVADPQQRTTLITGPAGAGKTTLLADWAAERADSATPLAWLTIDEADNSVEALCAALRQAVGTAVQSSLSATSSEIAEPDADRQDMSIGLSEALDASADGLCLVIDEAHLLREPAPLAMLARLLRWAPDTVHFLIAGRFEPPLGLYRARLSLSLTEINCAALAFSETEAVDLFRNQSVEVSRPELTSLMQWTEGWAAGLQLAALTSSRSSSGFDESADFVGDGASLTDYIVGEFLAVLSGPVRQLLVMTSILETFSADLAVRLSRNNKAQQLLDQLVHNGFLLQRSQCRMVVSYRLHPLIRRQLRAEIKLLDEELRVSIERDAATWHLDTGRPVEALRCAIATNNGELVLDVIDRCGIEVLISTGGHLIEMLDQIPLPTQKTTAISLLTASAHIGNGDVAAASALLKMIGTRASPEETATEKLLHETLRTQVALSGEAVSRSEVEVELARLVGLVEHTGPDTTPDGQAFVLLHAAVAEMVLGRLESAERKMVGALGRAQMSGSPAALMHCHGIKSVLCLLQGKLSASLSAAEKCLTLAVRLRATRAVTPSIATLVRDYTKHLRVEPFPARPSGDCIDLTGSAFGFLSEAAIRMAVLLADPGPGAVSRGRLTPNHPPDRDPLPANLHALLAAETQQLLLSGGNYSQAHQYASYVRTLLPGNAEGAVLAAMHRLSVGRRGSADAALAPAIDGLPSAHPVTEVWTHLIHAVLIESVDPKQTFHALMTALESAEAEQISRPFWLLRSPIRSLLIRHRGRFGASESYALHLRSLMDEESTPSVFLSPRELDVLRELASSRPASVIAADLSISVNTAKTHLRGIYRKLGVSNKWDALTVAQNSGLL